MEIVYIDITRGVLFDSWQEEHRMNLRPALFYFIQKKRSEFSPLFTAGLSLAAKMKPLSVWKETKRRQT